MAERRESVRLELNDAGFSTGMAKAAAATKLLDKSLDGLDGSTTDVTRSMPRATKETTAFGQASRRTTSDINQLTGRMAVVAKIGATLGPALAPIGAVGIAGVAGLASQLGFASAGALSMIVAFQGVGDALEAVNEAALEPTADNLAKAQEAMAKIGPEAQAFVTRFQALRPVLNDLRDSAAAGLFPGITESLDALESAAPRLERILFAVSKATGDAIGAGAESLAGPRWAEFLEFFENEAPDAITALSKTVGSLAHGFAELWMAFDPVNDSVRDWLVDAADGFDEWAQGLSETEGFKDFVEYLNTNGPKVADAAAAIGNALVQITQAAAPLGGPVLDAITAVADAIALIADSPLGTPIMAGVAAMSALSLATNVATASLTRFKAAQAALGFGGKGGAGALAGGPGTLAIMGGLSGLVNGLNQIKEFQDESQGLGESLLKLAPGFRELNILSEQFGINIPGITKEASSGVADLSMSVTGMGEAFAGASRSAYEAEAAIQAVERATLGAFSATTTWREALKAARAQAESNNAGIRGNSEAALANRRALESLAGAWQQQRDEMAAAGASTDRIADRQRAARQAFIEVATGMGVAKGRARELANELLGIPKKATPKVELQGADAAISSANAVEQSLTNLNGKTATTYVVTRHMTKGAGSSTAAADPARRASGGLVTGPGGPTDDLIPAYLSNREYVIKASAVERYGVHFFDALNAERLAGGGQPGRGRDGGRDSRSVWQPVGIDLPDTLKGLSKALKASEKALERETTARDKVLDKMSEVSSSASGLMSSDLYSSRGPWSTGGGLGGLSATLSGDVTTGQSLLSAIGQLKALGLDGDALAAALNEAPDAASFISLAQGATVESVAQYEAMYATRASIAAQVGGLAGAAAYGASLKPLEKQVAQVTAEIKVLQAIAKAADKNNTNGQKKAADSTKRGAGSASRSSKKGRVPA